jgi:hypothetical protein
VEAAAAFVVKRHWGRGRKEKGRRSKKIGGAHMGKMVILLVGLTPLAENIILLAENITPLAENIDGVAHRYTRK